MTAPLEVFPEIPWGDDPAPAASKPAAVAVPHPAYPTLVEPIEADEEAGAEAEAQARVEAACVMEALDHRPVGIDIGDALAVIAYQAGLISGDGQGRRMVPLEHRDRRRAWLAGYDFALASAAVIAEAMRSRVGRRRPRRAPPAAYPSRSHRPAPSSFPTTKRPPHLWRGACAT
jgi:hypothetical protein